MFFPRVIAPSVESGKLAHQFWISYHPPTGNKHTSSGDESPPIKEEDLEQQKIEHERQVQKEKECQAREAEEVRMLDIKLLRQRAIGAEEEQRENEIRNVKPSLIAPSGTSSDEEDAILAGINEKSGECATPKSECSFEAACNSSRTTGIPSIIHPDISVSDLSGLCMRDGASQATYNYNPMDSQITQIGDNFLEMTDSAECFGQPQGRRYDGEHMANGDQPGPSNIGSNGCSSNDYLISKCRAPIASLDCMDDFSTHSGLHVLQPVGYNMSRHASVYMGNHASMPSSVTPGLRYKNLGKSGLRVPNIGLGLWTMLNEDVAEDLIMTALENGINLFDLSEAHYAKGETELGRILKKRNVRRSSVIITTKIYWSTKSDERGQSRKHIIETVKSSLARLQLEYIDVVLLHKVDHVCPMEELVRAMNYLVNQGYVMYWGTARWTPSEIMDAYSKCRAFNCCTPVVEQTEYHMFCRDKAELYMPELYHKIGVGTMVWSAITTGKGLNHEETTSLFAKSRFNRKYSTFSWCEEDPVTVDEVDNKDTSATEELRTYKDKLRALSNLANNLNCTIRQLAVAWCLKNENVNCLLLGATSVEQFKENIHALQIVPQLCPAVMVDIERILANKPQRPPMISTLAMRNQQNNANRTDAAGASTSGADTPKGDVDVEANVATPEKEGDSKGCSESLLKDSKPKFFLNNAGEVIRRVEHDGITSDTVVSVSSLKGKQPASGGSKVKKSKSESSRSRSASLQRSSSGQLSVSRDRKMSRFNLGSPADV
ncbi:unnamed protein product [Leptosia nina]|uniref:NADP-dependent oxidoreductase domain-containing protein n=1 Tax=Leptosia nina TaxID=320188 RepID=A0AAV1K350_9NEOP